MEGTSVSIVNTFLTEPYEIDTYIHVYKYMPLIQYHAATRVVINFVFILVLVRETIVGAECRRCPRHVT